MVAVGPKTWNATVTAVDGDMVTAEVGAKWWNYHDGGGLWLPIDPSFTDVSGGGFEHVTSPWSVSCPRYATGRIAVYNDQDYNPHTGTTFTLTTTPALELDHPDASPVEGIIDPDRPSRIVYPNALGDNVDLAAGLWPGRYPRAEHLVIIRGLPAGDMDAVITERIYTPLRIPGWTGSATDVGPTGAALLAAGDPDLGIRMRPAVAWYYDQTGQMVTCPVSVVVERRLNAGYVLLTKTIPRWFIAQALAAGAYVIADETTTTYYPDATETTCVDGMTEHFATGAAWSTIRDGAGNTADNNGTFGGGGQLRSGSTSSKWDYMDRCLYLFDTSSMGYGATVSSATLSLWGNSKNSTLAAMSLNITSSNPASNTSLTGTDYSTCGSVEFSTRIAHASWSTTGYNDFTLNSSGRANISPTGISKFATRNGWDIDNSPPTWSGATRTSALSSLFAEQTGTANDPKLVVTYTAGGGANNNNLLLLGVG